jgi:hypothetical protein
MTTEKKEQTVKDWLERMTKTNKSTDLDSVKMQNLLRRCGFPLAVVTCGIVYVDGVGRPLSLHAMAEMILKTVG